jgi:hypothetical protein
MITIVVSGPSKVVGDYLAWLTDQMSEVDPGIEIEIADDTVALMQLSDAVLPPKITIKIEVN